MSEALIKLDAPEMAIERPHPREIIRQATEEANVLAEVIEKQRLYSMIQGKKFVKCEGWVTLATLRGCLPREVSVTESTDSDGCTRYVAVVELCRIVDGVVLTRASAECGGSGDSIWKGRPANARRSMAITRATGKACRVAFSWVMSLAGYEVTPAEEMDHVGGQPPEDTSGPAPRAKEATPRQWPARGVPAPTTPPANAPVWRGKIVDVKTKNGTTKGKAWTLYTLIGNDGTEFGTFSESILTGLMAIEGHFVEIVYSTTERGNKSIEEFRDVSTEEVPI